MNPITTRFDDSAEPGADGLCEYSYIGTLFDFEDGVSRGFIVRVYDDSPEEASFLSFYERIGKKKLGKVISHIPYGDTFFVSVAKHLVANCGIKIVKALTSQSGGYEPVKI